MYHILFCLAFLVNIASEYERNISPVLLIWNAKIKSEVELKAYACVLTVLQHFDKRELTKDLIALSLLLRLKIGEVSQFGLLFGVEQSAMVIIIDD